MVLSLSRLLGRRIVTKFAANIAVIPNFDTTSGTVENLLIVATGSLCRDPFGAGVAARATAKI